MAWVEAGERISPTVPASLTAGKSNTVETPPLKLSDDKIREECSRISHRRRESRHSQLSVASSAVIMASQRSIFYKKKRFTTCFFLSETVKCYSNSQENSVVVFFPPLSLCQAKQLGQLQVRRDVFRLILNEDIKT